jgi:hypothetical protein
MPATKSCHMNTYRTNNKQSVDGEYPYSSQDVSFGERPRWEIIETDFSVVNETCKKKYNNKSDNISKKILSRPRQKNYLKKQVCMPFLAGMCSKDVGCCERRHPSKKEAGSLVSKLSEISCRYGKKCRIKGCLYFHSFNDIKMRETKTNENTLGNRYEHERKNKITINTSSKCKGNTSFLHKSWSDVVTSPTHDSKFLAGQKNCSFVTKHLLKEETNSTTTTTSSCTSMELDQDTTFKFLSRNYGSMSHITNSNTISPNNGSNHEVSLNLSNKKIHHGFLVSMDKKDFFDTMGYTFSSGASVVSERNTLSYENKRNQDDIISAADEMELLLPLNIHAKEFVPRASC